MENFEINKENNSVILSVNPKLYPLDVIYSAAYTFTENCYVLLDGDPEQEVIVELKPKENLDLNNIALEFQNELISYANYALQSVRNSRIREIILERALGALPRQNTDYLEKDSKPWKNEEDSNKPESESS